MACRKSWHCVSGAARPAWRPSAFQSATAASRVCVPASAGAETAIAQQSDTASKRQAQVMLIVSQAVVVG